VIPKITIGLPALPEGARVYVRPSVRGVCVRDGKAMTSQRQSIHSPLDISHAISYNTTRQKRIKNIRVIHDK
jgi:hypothetical protein